MPGNIEINENLLRVIGEIADSEGIEAYVVGGFVRDYFLGIAKKDLDVTVVGDSLEFAKKVARQFKSKPVVFQKFRTAMVPVDGFRLEFVGTRKEVYEKNSRKPIVTEGTLEDDLKRRDFTVNAMAASLNSSSLGEVIDLFNGMQDLGNKLLRTPLEPEVTFDDDPLRMMRLARFASNLEFEVDNAALVAARKMAERIKIVSQERITDEFLKIMQSNKPSIGLFVLYDTGLLEHVFPELNALAGVEIVREEGQSYAHKDVLRHTFKVVDNTAKLSDKLWLRFAALMHDIAKPKTKRFTEGQGWTFHGHEEIGARWMKRLFRQMKLPLEHQEYVEKLVRLHQRPMALVNDDVTDSAIRRLAVAAGDTLEDLFDLCRADITTKNPNLGEQYRNNYEHVFNKVIEIQDKDKLREFQSPVRGEEIMQLCGIPPSRLVGYIKSNIEEAILEGDIPNEYESAKEYFLEYKDKWIQKYDEGG